MLTNCLRNELASHLAAHPVDASEVLTIVADAMAAYETAIQEQRDTTARAAIWALMMGALPKPLRTVNHLIDAAFYQFPRGVSAHCEAERKFWAMFLDAASQGVDIEWLDGTRGPDVVRWWRNVVEPALKERG